jgi:hypothetical protein
VSDDPHNDHRCLFYGMSQVFEWMDHAGYPKPDPEWAMTVDDAVLWRLEQVKTEHDLLQEACVSAWYEGKGLPPGYGVLVPLGQGRPQLIRYGRES